MAENSEKTASKARKENFFSKAGNSASKFFRDTKSEIKKMVWPEPKSVFRNTGVVLVTILVIGLFVFGLDTLMVNLLSLIMNISQ